MKFIFMDESIYNEKESNKGKIYTESAVILKPEELGKTEQIFEEVLERYGCERETEIHMKEFTKIKNTLDNCNKLNGSSTEEIVKQRRQLLYELMEKVTYLNIFFTTAIVPTRFPINIGPINIGLRLAYKFALERAVPAIEKGDKVIVIHDESNLENQLQNAHILLYNSGKAYDYDRNPSNYLKPSFMKEHFKREIDFSSSGIYRGLQLADIVAYVMRRKHTHNRTSLVDKIVTDNLYSTIYNKHVRLNNKIIGLKIYPGGGTWPQSPPGWHEAT